MDTTKLASRSVKAIQAALFLALTLFLLVTFIGFLVPQAIGQLKESEKWVKVSVHSVQFFDSTDPISSKSCKAPYVSLKNPQITEEEYGAICQSFSTKELDEFVTKTVTQQHIAAAMFGTISTLLLLIFLKIIINKDTATSMNNRLTKKKMTQESAHSELSLETTKDRGQLDAIPKTTQLSTKET